MQSPDDTLVDVLRQRITAGVFTPASRLSEAALATDLNVSRNTLREAFRSLTEQGLLVHIPHRGVFVAAPTVADIVDIYRVRRTIEPPALAGASPQHPATTRMDRAVQDAETAATRDDWAAIASANLAFHAAVVALSDSDRLNRVFRNLSAELRLAFLSYGNPADLHAPFVERNREVLSTFRAVGGAAAADMLKGYLADAERTLLGAALRAESGRYEMR